MAKTNYLGHNNEPPQQHGPKREGRKPWVHSHSAHKKTMIKKSHGGKRSYKGM